ncbi:MAG: primosomal protein N' [Myxococcota bacterium]|nr:primosomal protein N' [Myxococcota bacterium]
MTREGGAEAAQEGHHGSDASKDQVAIVQLCVPLAKPLSYLCPREWGQLSPRQLVLAPLNQRPVLGYVVAMSTYTSEAEARISSKEEPQHRTAVERGETSAYLPLLSPLPALAPLPEELLQFLLRFARYYCALPHEALRLALPRFPEKRGYLLLNKPLEPPRNRDSRKRESASVTQRELFNETSRRREQRPAPKESSNASRLSEKIDRIAPLLRWGPLPAKTFPISLSKEERTALENSQEIQLLNLPSVAFVESPWISRAAGAPVKPKLSPKREKLYRALSEEPQPVSAFLEGNRARALLSEFNRHAWLSWSKPGQDHVDPAIQASSCFEANPPSFPLTEEQQNAISAIESATDRYRGFLLHGVTGSGKTEVYLSLIESQLKRGAGVIVLVPEIGLTPQTFRRFEARLGPRVALWHSELSPQDRAETWGRLSRGEVPVILGARSALFAPIPRLGLIIVDESHDSAYKQGDGIRYHARDAALLRGSIAKCPVVLGTATPSLESVFNCQRGKLQRLSMQSRPAGAQLPRLELIDMSRSSSPHPQARYLSGALIEAIRVRLQRREQSIIFLNRRGFSHRIRCLSCGHCFRCDQCAVSLTWHQQIKRLCCHYCDRKWPLPQTCPACEGHRFDRIGRGTEQLEFHLQELFPRARIARLDRDSASDYRALEEEMRAGQIDLLLGTQMVTKGHDFPGVTLVGVVDADDALSLPDFRATERAFQLLSQVAGRAGRADRAGEVLIQTWQPRALALRALKEGQDAELYRHELSLREQIGYPPYQHAVLIRVDSPEQELLAQDCETVSAWLRGQLEDAKLSFRMKGPSPAPLTQLQGRHRWQILLLISRSQLLSIILSQLQAKKRSLVHKNSRISIDVDPIQLL